MARTITLKLTPIQAKILFNTVDGAADAGACVGGNTKQEARAFEAIMRKLLDKHEDWKEAQIVRG